MAALKQAAIFVFTCFEFLPIIISESNINASD